MRLSCISVVLAAACVALPAGLRAQETQPADKTLTLSGGLDLVTSYYWRGFLQEDSGIIAQPYVELDATLYKQDSFSITPFARTWNSIHSNTGEESSNAGEWGGTRSNWFEADLIGGAKFTLDDFQVTPFYTAYMLHPDDHMDTAHEASLLVAYNDAAVMKQMGCPVTLNPYVLYSIDISGDRSDPAYVYRGEQFQYIELGLAPTFMIPNTPVTLAFPLAVGLGPDGLYRDLDGQDTWLGYWSAGIMASTPLPIADRYGKWTLAAGVTYLRVIADNARYQNNGSIEGDYNAYFNGGDPDWHVADGNDAWIGKIGVAFVY